VRDHRLTAYTRGAHGEFEPSTSIPDVDEPAIAARDFPGTQTGCSRSTWRGPGISGLAISSRSIARPAIKPRDINSGAPVTSDTVFPICSVTKSFATTALALLVDEGRLDWDAPVRAVLPEFRPRDPVATEQASLRDLLTTCTRIAAV
jgi:CubicO group peptidase (beta-lactamase class C family)